MTTGADVDTLRNPAGSCLPIIPGMAEKSMAFGSVVLCLATEKGWAVVRSLEPLLESHRFTVCTLAEKDVRECYQRRIQDEARRLGIALIELQDWQNNAVEILKRVSAEAIVCVGWRYRISNDAMAIVDGNVFVAHDSLLPKLRGFAALPTAMITGERETGVTLVRAEPTIDSGPIYWQSAVAIGDQDTIAELIRRVLPLYVQGVQAAISGILGEPLAQDETLATYSIWRDNRDYFLDWSESAEMISRKVRALGSPYLGAKTRLGDRAVIVKNATPLEDLRFAIRQPGKVWSVNEAGRPTVICGTGLLRIDEAEFEDGESLLPLRRMRVRFE